MKEEHLVNFKKQHTVSLLKVVTEGSRLTELFIGWNNLSGVDPEILVRAVTKLKVLNIMYAKLIQQQAEAILNSVIEGNTLTQLDILAGNNLTEINQELLATAAEKVSDLH